MGSEDCLYLNVFGRHLDPAAKRPVIVYIHGGSFIHGGADKMTAEFMLEQVLGWLYLAKFSVV